MNFNIITMIFCFNKDNITNNNTYLVLFIIFLIGFIVFLIGSIYYYRRSNADKKNKRFSGLKSSKLTNFEGVVHNVLSTFNSFVLFILYISHTKLHLNKFFFG